MRFFIFVFSILFSITICANPKTDKTQLSRRGFLRGLLGAGAVAAVNPMSVLSSGFGAVNAALPEALKRHIVKVRLRTISVVGESAAGQVADPFLGLKNYIKFLEDLALDPNNASYNSALLNKLKAAKQSLTMFEQAYLKNINSSSDVDTKSTNSSETTQGQNVKVKDSVSNNDDQNYLNQLREMPMDLRIIALRSMIGVDLLRRMAWQVHYSGVVSIDDSEVSLEGVSLSGNQLIPTVILTEDEFKIIEKYHFYLLKMLEDMLLEKTFLNSKGMLEGFENISMAELLVNHFIEESGLVIRAYKTAQNLNNSNLPQTEGLCYGYLIN